MFHFEVTAIVLAEGESAAAVEQDILALLEEYGYEIVDSGVERAFDIGGGIECA